MKNKTLKTISKKYGLDYSHVEFLHNGFVDCNIGGCFDDFLSRNLYEIYMIFR
jgi:hypothetical protein